MSDLPNFIYRFKGSPIEIPANHFAIINKLIYMTGRKPRRTNTILKDKNKVGGQHYLTLRLTIKLQ
jgi:hypothetical protein